MNFAFQLDLHARSDPDALALVDDPTDRRWTWSQLLADVAGAQEGLGRLGLGVGDRIGLLLHNRPELIILFVAALRAGIVPVLLNVRWSADELRLALDDAEPEALVCERTLADDVGVPATRGLGCRLIAGPADGGSDPGSLESAQAPSGAIDLAEVLRPASGPVPPPRARSLEDLAEVMYTSGSTGRPKGVLHHHGHHVANSLSLIDHFELRRQDVALVPFPLFHQSGQVIWSVAFALGGPVVLMRRWRGANFARIVEAHRVTYTHLITTAVTELAATDDHGRDTSSLRLTLYGGGSTSADLAHAYERSYGGVLCSGYGRSEGGYSWEPPDRERRRFDRNGTPLRGTAELRVVDVETGVPCPTGNVGEIRVRGDAVARGYWRRPDLDRSAFDDEGFMRTGDLGVLDADGYLTFKGRADGMIKSGGENVYPSEVERVLLSMPAVAAAAVVGVPDPRLGQRIAAVVVPGEEATSVEAVDAWCRARLSGYKRPRSIVLVDAVPMLGSGKVDYAAVARLLAPSGAHLQTVPDAPPQGVSAR